MLSDGEPRTLPDPRHLGQRIASLRHANGWSQRRLAQAAGVSHGYVGLLELGRLPNPGKFRLDAVARALNLPTADALLAPSADLPRGWSASRAGPAEPRQPSSASAARAPDLPPRSSSRGWAPRGGQVPRSSEASAPPADRRASGGPRPPADASAAQPATNV